MGEAGGESLEGLEWGAGWGTHSALWVCGCGEVAGVGKSSACGWEQLWDAELEHLWGLPEWSSCAQFCSHIPPVRGTGSRVHPRAEKMGKFLPFGHSSLCYSYFLGMGDRRCWRVFKTTKLLLPAMDCCC